MFAAAFNRVDVINLLARRGADLKATSKVVDLYDLTREEAPRPAGNAGGGGRPAPLASAAPAVRRCPGWIAPTTTPS